MGVVPLLATLERSAASFSFEGLPNICMLGLHEGRGGHLPGARTVIVRPLRFLGLAMALARALASLRTGVLLHVSIPVSAGSLQAVGACGSLQLVRHFAEGTYLDKSEVEERVLKAVKNFDKVDPSKARRACWSSWRPVAALRGLGCLGRSADKQPAVCCQPKGERCTVLRGCLRSWRPAASLVT